MKPSHWLVAAGAVLIENNRVLLVREQKDGAVTPWMFPGGQVEDFDQSFEAAAIREAKEEVALEVQIIKPLKSVLIHKKDVSIVLIHFLASCTGIVEKGKDGFIVAAEWHIITKLPTDLAPNVSEVINDYLRMI